MTSRSSLRRAMAAARIEKQLDWIRGRELSTGRSSYRFDRDIGVQRVSSRLEVSGRVSLYRGNVQEGWAIAGAPNGGYLMAMAMRAAAQELKFKDPLSVSGHYVATAIEQAEATIQVRVLKEARTTATVAVDILQSRPVKSGTGNETPDKDTLEIAASFLATFGSLEKNEGLTHVVATAPSLPSVEKCFDCAQLLRETWGDHLTVADRFDLFVPTDAPLLNSFMEYLKSTSSGKAPSLPPKEQRKAILEGWGGLSDKQPPNLETLLFLSDAYPPPILNIEASGWVPTIELTVHLFGDPKMAQDTTKENLVRVRTSTEVCKDGMLATDGDIWSADGKHMLARSRQLARLWVPVAKKKL